MRDTIELLESIGGDATLRYASTEVLTHALTAENASTGVHEFVTNGDGTTMKRELGLAGEGFGWQVEHHSQTVGLEDNDIRLH